MARRGASSALLSQLHAVRMTLPGRSLASGFASICRDRSRDVNAKANLADFGTGEFSLFISNTPLHASPAADSDNGSEAGLRCGVPSPVVIPANL